VKKQCRGRGFHTDIAFSVQIYLTLKCQTTLRITYNTWYKSGISVNSTIKYYVEFIKGIQIHRKLLETDQINKQLQITMH
jgi:hypothetical protein